MVSTMPVLSMLRLLRPEDANVRLLPCCRTLALTSQEQSSVAKCPTLRPSWEGFDGNGLQR